LLPSASRGFFICPLYLISSASPDAPRLLLLYGIDPAAWYKLAAGMMDKHEVDLTDDDMSLMSATEDMGLLSQRTHRRSSSFDSLVVYTKSFAHNMQDPDFVKNAVGIAVLVVLWHSFSMSISIVSAACYESFFGTRRTNKSVQ
jgi:hypothetical protein